MRGYSEREVFPARELALFRRTTAIVDRLLVDTNAVRCHELARAFGLALGLTVQDGFYGFADHSWLWLDPVDPRRLVSRLGWPNILDVYAVGRLPMVQLVMCGNPGLPHIGWSYRPGDPRTDINGVLVEQLRDSIRVADDELT